LKALEGKRTIKETTSALASCWKAILAGERFNVPPLWDKESPPAGSLSETGGTGEDSEFGVRSSRFQEPRTTNL
jgi:hypothetical protein